MRVYKVEKKSVEDISGWEKKVTKEIIKFLRRNRGHAFTRDEIIDRTGYNPIYMRHAVLFWSIDDYGYKNGYYYYEVDWDWFLIAIAYLVFLLTLLTVWTRI